MEAIHNVLNFLVFGIELWRYILFFSFVIFGIISGRIINSIFRNFVKRKSAKLKVNFLVNLLDIIESPLFLLIFALGFNLGSQFLSLNQTAGKIFNNILFVLVQIAIFWFILRFIDLLVDKYARPLAERTETKLDDHIVSVLQKTVKGATIILAIIIILSNLGYDILTLMAGLGVGGLAIALAAQDSVKNIFAGIYILIDKPFRIKEWIGFNGVAGNVIDIGLRCTRLESEKGSILILPNSLILNSVIENFSVNQVTHQTLDLGISPFTPAVKIEEAIKAIKEVILSVKGTDSKILSVRFVSFGESSLDLKIIYGLIDRNWRMVIHNVNLGIKRALDEIGVELAVPIERQYRGKDWNDTEILKD